MSTSLPLSLMVTADQKTRSCKPKTKAFFTAMKAFHVLFHFIPKMILVINFFRSIWYMWKTPRLKKSFLARRRKRITFLLLSLTVSYIVLKFPILIWQVLRESGQLKTRTLRAVYRPAALAAYLTTVVDPVLYAVCWRGFRQGFMQVKKGAPKMRAMSNLSNTDTNNTTLSAASIATISSMYS